MDAVKTTEPTAHDDESGPGGAAEDPAEGAEPMLVEELLVEEVSIDGMCGVY
jgi:mycofactocin precursor